MNSANISVSLFTTPRPLSRHSPLFQGNVNLAVVTERRDIISPVDATSPISWSACIFMRICLKVLLLVAAFSFCFLRFHHHCFILCKVSNTLALAHVPNLDQPKLISILMCVSGC